MYFWTILLLFSFFFVVKGEYGISLVQLARTNEFLINGKWHSTVFILLPLFPICFLLFSDYLWFLFILFEILTINTWWRVLVKLKQYICSVYIAMKLSSLEVVEKLVRFWLTGVTVSLITHRQITAYYTHHNHPHNFIPSLLRPVLRALVYSQNILQVSTEVGGCLQCGWGAMRATKNKNIPNIYQYTWWSEKNVPRLHRGICEGQYCLRHFICGRGHTQSYPVDTVVLPCWVWSVPNCRNTGPQSPLKNNWTACSTS